ncbi:MULTISPECIES: DUF3168 domain-containing protein [Methylosinus]|uniref:DUF3168 domain-containing protein n=1 Tax=Methylosinus trichosporium (strain ATCC 35070 / NCIMB 11131 / UNIQEM 75 / OB3b) TaxID=595536 RepID=A0A2D2CWL1_METT3|nr:MULTISPECIES: DUF3168 domain-containing protein [Methylosinus]ATQ67151.1 DUF3168 domain-containing protein [Methylosinus trichosporium OB3b]OBS52699.1 hypothetical protein A8B73_09485 [Methylosinus sp. 3S-1]
MSVSPAVALRKAIISRLASDTALTGALGGAKFYDEAPRAAEPPYVVFAETQTRDWSSALSPGAEQFFVLSVISVQRGARQALDLAERIVALLDEAPLSLDGHHLVDLRHLSSATRREQSGRFARADLRFRATTETLG